MGAPEVLLFTIDAGGGHRAAARALVAAAEETGAPFRFRVESFQQMLLPLDVLKRATGVSLEDAYNLILRRHANALMVPLLRLMHAGIRVRRGALVRTLAGWLRAQPRPAAVVSVFPNFNGVMRDALREALPGVPLVVVLTDLADFPPRFWIEPGHRPRGRGHRRGARAGARDRDPGRAGLPRLGDGPAPALLPRGRAGGARARARAELGARRRRFRGDPSLRRQGLARDGAARRAPARGGRRPCA